MRIRPAILLASLVFIAPVTGMQRQSEGAASVPQPAAELKGLEDTFTGRWLITMKLEPDESMPHGGSGDGEQIYRTGPGGFTFMEEEHTHMPTGEQFGVAFVWWDSARGLRGLWCVNTNPNGCDVESAVAPDYKCTWDGKEWVIDFQFSRRGKKLHWHEVYSDITHDSFTQIGEVGEVGGPLRRVYMISAKRAGVH
jgi:hypothetical protein